jgi:hypothetical protein
MGGDAGAGGGFNLGAADKSNTATRRKVVVKRK